MSFDDPFKQMKDFNRQLESTRDIFTELEQIRSSTTIQAEELNAIQNQHRLAYGIPEVEASRIPPELMDELSAAMPKLHSEMASLSSLEEQVAESWKNYQQFHDGLAPTHQVRDHFKEIGLAEVLLSVRAMRREPLNPIGTMQQALRDSLREAESLQKSLPILQLEEKLADLKTVTGLPEIASELSQVAKGLEGLTPNALPPDDLLASLRSAADTLRLPYLEAAAAQWTAMLPTLSPASLAAETLLQATISAVSSAASYRGATTLDPLISEWEMIVANEESKHDGGRLPDWMQGFLLNLLLFMMSLAAQNASESRINEKLKEIREGQSAIVATIEVDAEDKSEPALDTSEGQTLELGEIMKWINAVSELRDEEAEAGGTENLRYTSNALRLRALPALDSEILWKIPKGMAVEIVEKQGGWSSVRVKDFATGNLRAGWASSQYLVEWDELDFDSGG